MKKNILEQFGAEDVLTRIQTLKASTTAVWGTMTVAQMLRHCNDINTSILESDNTQKQPRTLKHHLFRTLLLYVLPQIPKGIKGPKRFTANLQDPGIDFDTELRRYKEIAQRFPQHTSEITLAHPFVGRLNTRQWGRFAWMHLDHHLRQFGA